MAVPRSLKSSRHHSTPVSVHLSTKPLNLTMRFCCTVGDADFSDVELAAIAGLLKLFLVSIHSLLSDCVTVGVSVTERATSTNHTS